MKRRGFLLGVASTAAGCGFLSPKTVVSSSRSLRLEDGHFFGHDLRGESSIAYVLDLSGSMSERTGSKVEQVGKDAAANVGGSLLSGVAGEHIGTAAEETVLDMDQKVELVKDHLIASLRGLPAGARFNVVTFSGGVQTLAPSLVEANAASTSLVGAFVSRLEAGGSTSLKTAIGAGFDTGAAELMVLTDGLPTDSSPDEILSMVRERNSDKRHRIFTVGVGSDQAKHFLTTLAAENGGRYTAYS